MDKVANFDQLSVKLDNAFTIICTLCIFVMTFGVSLFNASLSQRKNWLTMVGFSALSMILAGIGWFTVGYQMLSSKNGNFFISNFDTFFLPKTIFTTVNEYIPNLIKLYSGWVSAALSITILSAMISGRGRLSSALIFLFLWSLLVLNVINYWIYNPSGWAYNLDVINAAGGGPSIAIGVSSLVYSWYLGKRRIADNVPHSQVLVLVATFLIWFGWCGIGGTLTGGFNQRAIISIVNLNIGGISGGLIWIIIQYFKTKKISIFSFCVGAIGGFLGVATSAPVVSFISAATMGMLGSITCNYSTIIAKKLNIDDHLDLFAFQGMGSLASLMFASVFAENKLYGLIDDYKAPNGLLDMNWIQPLKQLTLAICCAIWALLISFLIILFIDKVLRLKLRINFDQEEMGLDHSCLGDVFYKLKHDFEPYDANSDSIKPIQNV